MRSLLIFLTLFLLLNVTSARGEEPKPFRIGGIVALTGAASGWGNKARQGWELAVEELNAGGGVEGRKVELILEDSKTSASGSVSAFHKLTATQELDALVGDVWDFFTTPLISLVDAKKILLVSTILDQSSHKRSPYYYTLGPRIESVAPAVDQFFKLNPSVQSVSFLSWDNAWAYAYEEVWKAAIARHGARLLQTQRTADLATDWRAEVTRVAIAKPEAIFFSFQADRILRRLKEQQLSPRLLTSSNIVEELTLKTVPTELAEGLFYTDWIPHAGFIHRFTERFGEAPALNAADAYEAVRSIAHAAQLSPKDPHLGMSKVRYQGVTGPIDFSESMSGNHSTARLMVVRDGRGIPAANE